LAKRGEGRFSGEYVFSIMDSFANPASFHYSPFSRAFSHEAFLGLAAL
jgi:hypothetical protein